MKKMEEGKVHCANPKCDNWIQKGRKKYCSEKCKYRSYYYSNLPARLESSKKYAKEKYENDPSYVENKKKTFSEWYQKNKLRHKKNVMKNYRDNKGKWRERGYVTSNRSKLLEILPKSCAVCGNENVTIIAHKTFDNIPTRTIGRKDIDAYLTEYAKVLVPICNKTCLGKWRRTNAVDKKK